MKREAVKLWDSAHDCQMLYFTTLGITRDDRKVLFIQDEKTRQNIFVYDLDRKSATQLTDHNGKYLKSYQYLDGTPYQGLGMASPSFDYSQDLLYYIQGTKILVSDLKGRTRILAELPKGQMTAYTHISEDGRRLCVPTVDEYALEGEKQLSLRLRLDYDIDKRVVENNLSSYLRVFDTQTGKEILQEKVERAWITHVQFSPRNNDVILYNNEWPHVDCGIRRMWLWDGKKHLRLRTEGDGRKGKDWTCHEVWERDASRIVYHGHYSGSFGYLGMVNPDGSGLREIALPTNYKRYGHFTPGKRGMLVSDGYYREEQEPDLGYAEWISLQEMNWEQRTIRWIPICKHGSNWDSQDSHPHPVFNHRCDRVLFTSNKDGKRAVYAVEV